MAMFIHFLCFCPLSLAIKLNFNISKVAYWNLVSEFWNPVSGLSTLIYTMVDCRTAGCGLRDCGTAGLRDCGTAGLRDCGTAGLRDCGTADRGSNSVKHLVKTRELPSRLRTADHESSRFKEGLSGRVFRSLSGA